MRKWITAVSTALVLSLFSTVGLAAKFDSKNPYSLIKSVADDTFTHLKANQAKYQKNPELLRKVAQDDVIPYINVRYAAMSVLGPYAKKATKEERDQFTQAFDDYLVLSYAQIFARYTDQKVVVEPPKEIDKNRNIVSVQVNLIDKNRPPINLDFKLRKNRKTQDWQAFDVQVEGVSMLNTKASEWQGELRKKGVSAVADQLIKLAKEPIKVEK